MEASPLFAIHPGGSMTEDKGSPLGHRIVFQEHFELLWRPWEVWDVLPHFTGKQTKAQRSSITFTACTRGQNLALSLGLPLRFLPLTSPCHTSCFLCSPPGQPGLVLASGALCLHTARGQKVVGTSWASRRVVTAVSGHLCLRDWRTRQLGTMCQYSPH